MKNLTRRSFLVQLSAVPLAVHAGSFAASISGRWMYAGTYTEKGSSQGIYAYRWDSTRGELQAAGLAAKTTDPGFLAVAPDHQSLYCVNEISDFMGKSSGSVSAFSRSAASGELKLRNVVPSGGSGPCNITVDHTGKAVFAADFAGGSVASFRVLSDGTLSDPVSTFHFTGHGTDPVRQESAHTHCVTVSPDNRYLLVNDLGLNRIMVFHLDAGGALLTPNSPAYYESVPGTGPRSLAFHPTGRWAYCATEMGNTIEALAWDSREGTLKRFQSASTLPAGGFAGKTTAATVAVDPTGRNLYASNRGADTIAVFSIQAGSGTLEQVQQISSGGKTPRHFALDPSNRWLLVANQDSGSIVIFARDPETGRLRATEKQVALDSPACLVFA